MAGRRGWRAAVLVVGAGLPAPAAAGSIFEAWKGPPCPPPSYSPLHYWAPALFRLSNRLHSPGLPAHAPDCYPHLPPPGYREFAYPCPPVDPAAAADRYLGPGVGTGPAPGRGE